MSAGRHALREEIGDRAERDRLRWRHVEDPCETCSGSGVRAYGNSSTWRGGMGAAAVTVDVCDTCWGTGDRFRRGLDLRALRGEERDRIAREALTALASSCGAQHKTCAPSIVTIIQHLEKLVDGRTRPPVHFTTGSLAQGLANLLRRAIGSPERKL